MSRSVATRYASNVFRDSEANPEATDDETGVIPESQRDADDEVAKALQDVANEIMAATIRTRLTV
jgi:hypothetical protein